MNAKPTLFEAAGGTPFFERFAAAFYRHVATDAVLQPMYPADDMAGAERRLALFLQQYWGGPDTYSQERGHPRLRMRHMPFRVTHEAREHWLTCMEAALDETEPPDAVRAPLWEYLQRAALAMVNTFDARS